MHTLKDFLRKLLIIIAIFLIVFIGGYIIIKLLDKSSSTLENSTENLMNKTVEMVDQK